MFLRVAVASPLPRHFDYLPPKNTDAGALMPGMRLRVPFGKREVIGVLLETAAHSDVPAPKLKHAQAVLDKATLIPPDLLALARWAADYYH
ncbi:MAG: primosomal protein N', partial [Gammaproteobacteria bacterium]|nr:primosomal protein N' [Gammaproteobacteria bacterium]